MRNYLGMLLLIFGWPMSDLAAADSYPLSLEQRAHLKAYAPRTFMKLESQRPVHIVALGDSVTWMYTRDENNGNWLLSYLGNFGGRLSRQFFYPGGVRALNPEKEHPEKLKAHLGEEIYIENLSIPGRCAIDAIQRVSTDAFVNQPDLVVIDFGINDSVRSHSLDSYRQALQRSVDACRANGADVILMAPSMIRASNGPTGWGMTRPYATVAREVAAKNQVLFVDLGAALAPLGGGVPAGVEAEAAVLTVSDRLSRIFEFDPMPETPEVLHPNEEAHAVMGRAMFEAFMKPATKAPDYKMGGRAAIETGDAVKVFLKLKNQTDKTKEGYLAALAMGRSLMPKDPFQSFSLKPGETRDYELLYERVASESAAGGNVAFDISDPILRLSYFVVDEEGSQVMDLVTRLQPVSIEWSQQSFERITDGVRFEWRFVNGLQEVARGKYRIGMGEAVSGWVDFSVEGLGAKKFQATFPFSPPKGAARFKSSVFVEVEVGGKKFTFPRELEAVRDMGLGQRVALSTFADYGIATTKKYPKVGMGELKNGASGVVLRADADENYLYFAFDFSDVAFSSVPGADALVADLYIDARPIAEVGTFGFVDKVRIRTGVTDGPVTVDRPQLAAFGDGYNMVLPAEGIRAELKTRSPGLRRLEVQVPRSYLFLYDGKVGSPDSVIGLNANLTMAALDGAGQTTFPAEKRFVISSPVGQGVQTMYLRDPRGYATLRLSSKPVRTWSAHLY